MEDLVTLDVRDDGTGFDPAADRPATADGGFGLTAMRERLHRIAGTLTVESEPGGGTAISACVPAMLATGAA
jgi:signal transduction histidine kinase